MAFYDQHPQHIRQQSWDPTLGPTRSGASSVSHGAEDSAAFRQQFEEVDRAHENMAKGGRPPLMSHGRRESVPIIGQFVGQFPPGQEPPMRPNSNVRDSRQTDRAGPPRHHSISDYEGLRSSSSSSSVQGFLQSQRFGPPRQSEADSLMQAKRRAAAQRERELRNYHQEQQYNRAQPGAKAERAMSPNAMNEEDRRELIARQHRALYGENSSLYDGPPRPASQDARVLTSPTTGHGSSPMVFDSFGQPSGSTTDGVASVTAPAGQGTRSRSNSATSKTVNPPGFAMFESAHTRTSNSSPGDGQAAQQGTAPPAGAVGAIGTRPSPAVAGQAKRGTPPVPSPLGQGFGFGVDKVASTTSAERSTPPTSTAPSSGAEKPSSGLGWGASSGPWGSTKNSLGQASVWG